MYKQILTSCWHTSECEAFRKAQKVRPLRAGFSLMEMMVVLLLIAMVAGMVAYNLPYFLNTGRSNAAKAELEILRGAVILFQGQTKRYPTNEEGLEIIAAEGLLKTNSIPLDPWGNPYQYNVPGTNSAFEIISFGADGQPGGDKLDADISTEDSGSE